MAVLILCIICAATAVCFGVRCFTLKRAVRAADEELVSITAEISANRRMKLGTPDKDLEGLLITMNEALEKLWQERVLRERKERELMGQIENISHDLRTPLTSILGYLDLMDLKELGSEEKEAVEVIQRKSKALQKLIGEFYDLTRIEAGDYLLEMKRTDACRAVRESIISFYENLTKAGLSVMMDIPEKPVFVLADEGTLDRIISNLVQNAVRYAKSVLAIHMEEKAGKVWIWFVNDTEHLTKEDVLYLFDRFYQKNRARNEEGTGLGLTIAKQLTEAMGGMIEAHLDGEKLSICIQFACSEF